MNLGKLGQAITGKEIFDLIHDDLDRVEKEISLETVASVDVVTQIGQYLQESGGKRLRPSLLLLASRLIGGPDGAHQRKRDPSGRGGGDHSCRHAGA